MRIASSDGVELVVHDLGGDGPPLIVSHATGFCGPMYQPLAHQLRRRYRVLAVDYRGHGDSTAPADGNMAWDGMGRDLGALLDSLGAGPFVGFGHSMGGAVLLIAARERPGAFSHLYLYEPIVPPSAAAMNRPDGENYMSGTARRRRATFGSKAEALHRYAAPRSPLSVLRADALYLYIEHGLADQPDGSACLKCSPEQEARTFEGAGNHMHAGLLPAIATPTVVAVGGQEAHLPPAQFAAQAASALPNGVLHHYPTLGHFGPFQDPVLVAERMVAFIDETTP